MKHGLRLQYSLVNRALDSKFQNLDIHPKLEAKEMLEFATIKEGMGVGRPRKPAFNRSLVYVK